MAWPPLPSGRSMTFCTLPLPKVRSPTMNARWWSFSAPETILALPDPGETMPYVKAMWRYSRGIAFAAQRNFDAARAEADAISALERATDFSLLKASGVPGEEVMRLARTVIQGRAPAT